MSVDPDGSIDHRVEAEAAGDFFASPRSDRPAMPAVAEEAGHGPLKSAGVARREEDTVGIAGEHLTGKQMAASFARALGREVAYNAVPPEVYRSFGFPGAEDPARRAPV